MHFFTVWSHPAAILLPSKGGLVPRGQGQTKAQTSAGGPNEEEVECGRESQGLSVYNGVQSRELPFIGTRAIDQTNFCLFFLLLSLTEKGVMVDSSPLFLENRICTKFISLCDQ